jgi:hypothetical protein
MEPPTETERENHRRRQIALEDVQPTSGDMARPSFNLSFFFFSSL